MLKKASRALEIATPVDDAVATLLDQLAVAAIELAARIADGASATDFAAKQGGANADGDAQRELDLIADDLFIGAARRAPVALYASEELDQPALLAPGAPLALAIDPLDGSSNIETNAPVGTIFSILPVAGDVEGDPLASFLRSGRDQIAAGFFIYGPQLALVLSVGAGTDIYVHSERQGRFVPLRMGVTLPCKTGEFAINAANYRHWDEPVRLYVDDCLQGRDGPREKDYNMRWIASLVAEAYRIFARGGIFLYPGDRRPGYGRGRLRQVYEANPIAMLVEQAGGLATSGMEPILDHPATALHQRVPLIFGARHEVERIARYYCESAMIPERAPLFSTRGLFRM